MSAESLRRMWEQQAELQKLIGADPDPEQPKQRRGRLPQSVRTRIAESLRNRAASRHKEAM